MSDHASYQPHLTIDMSKVHSYAFSKTSRLLFLVPRPTILFPLTLVVRSDSDEAILSFPVATQISPLYIKWEAESRRLYNPLARWFSINLSNLAHTGANSDSIVRWRWPQGQPSCINKTTWNGIEVVPGINTSQRTQRWDTSEIASCHELHGEWRLCHKGPLLPANYRWL